MTKEKNTEKDWLIRNKETEKLEKQKKKTEEKMKVIEKYKEKINLDKIRKNNSGSDIQKIFL